MAGKTNFLEGEFLKHILRTGSLSKPTGLWVALYTVAPTDAFTSGSPTGTEVTTVNTGYARASLGAPDDAVWAAPSGTPRVSSNVGAITFPTPSGSANWGTVVAFGILDASSGGNLLYWASLTTSKAVTQGDGAPSFLAGALIITED